METNRLFNFYNYAIIAISMPLLHSTQYKIFPIFVGLLFLFHYMNVFIHKEIKDKIFNILFLLLFLFFVFLCIRALFFDKNDGIIGDFLLSFLGNYEMGIIGFGVMFSIYAIFENNIFSQYVLICELTYILGIFVGACYFMGLDIHVFNTLLYVAPFVLPGIQYITKLKIVSYLYYIISILYCYMEDERAIMLLLIVAFAYYFYNYIGKTDNYLVNKLVSATKLLLPIIGVGLTIYNLNADITTFELASLIYGHDTSFVNDTRSFLFRELAQDFDMSSSWLFGKGMFGWYYSSAVEKFAGNGNRISTECGHLYLLLKGGYIYLFLYNILIFYSIAKSIKSKDKFIKYISFLLSITVLLMFISFTQRFDLRNVLMWLFVGILICHKNFEVQQTN